MVFTTIQVMEINDIPDAMADMQEHMRIADPLHMVATTTTMIDMITTDTADDQIIMRTGSILEEEATDY